MELYPNLHLTFLNVLSLHSFKLALLKIYRVEHNFYPKIKFTHLKFLTNLINYNQYIAIYFFVVLKFYPRIACIFTYLNPKCYTDKNIWISKVFQKYPISLHLVNSKLPPQTWRFFNWGFKYEQRFHHHDQ